MSVGFDMTCRRGTLEVKSVTKMLDGSEGSTFGLSTGTKTRERKCKTS